MNDLLSLAAGGGRAGSPVDFLVAFFVLSLVPLIAISTTSFARVIVVLSLLRASFGAQALPPNAVIAALALMLTAAIMAPTVERVDRDALQPYAAHHLTPAQALQRAAEPLRDFMLRQTRSSDIAALRRIARVRTRPAEAPPFGIVTTAFLLGELRAAFAMGFALALPFAVIDLVVAALLMSLGMYMVSPAALSLPIKLLLFVVADGWTLIAGALVASYR